MVKIYLDYAASTPVDPRVLAAMRPYFTEKFGNPGSLHSFGQEALAAVDGSRETIAKAVGADFREIIFTGSATEANNLALRGAINAIRKTRITHELREENHSGHSDAFVSSGRVRMIISSIEHESVLETARDLEREGVEVIYLPVDRRGIVDLKKLETALNERTILVSVMYANNEIGTIQPITEISQIVRNFREGSSVKRQGSRVGAALPLLHTDAAQAFQFLDCNVKKLGVDLLTLSSHKVYGPKGVGALYVSNKRQASSVKKEFLKANFTEHFGFLMPDACCLMPILTGGGQEFGLRSGTENVPGIVGFAKAVELISNSRELENKKIGKLRDYFWRELKKICPQAERNGIDGQKSIVSGQLLPNILNVYFPKHEAQFLLTKLDLAGVAASSGSACRSRALQSSYVIEALGYSKERAKRSIRFSLGRPTMKEEIRKAITVISRCLKIRLA